MGYNDYINNGGEDKMFFLRISFQVAILLGVSMLGNKLMQILNLHLPGSIFGIIFIFILLQTRIIRLQWIEAGANFLIAELLLFFIPSAVGVVQYKQLIVADGMQFGAVILLSTVTVMICTGLLAEFVNKMGNHNDISVH